MALSARLAPLVAGLAVALVAGCTPTATTPDTPPAGDVEQPDEQPDEQPPTAALSLQGYADEVCQVFSDAFEYAFVTLDADANDRDRALALHSEFTARFDRIPHPAAYADDAARIRRGMDLYILGGGFVLDGVELVQPDERDELGDPLDLWLELDSEELASELNAAPSCVALAARQDGSSFFATDGQLRDIPTPPTDGLDELDAYGALDAMSRRLFVLAATRADEPGALHDESFLTEVFAPLPQLQVTSTDRLTDAGVFTLTLDPATDGAAELAAELGFQDTDPIWCVWLPLSIDDGRLLQVPGDCADEDVLAELDQAQAEMYEEIYGPLDEGWDAVDDETAETSS